MTSQRSYRLRVFPIPARETDEWEDLESTLNYQRVLVQFEGRIDNSSIDFVTVPYTRNIDFGPTDLDLTLDHVNSDIGIKIDGQKPNRWKVYDIYSSGIQNKLKEGLEIDLKEMLARYVRYLSLKTKMQEYCRCF